MARRLIGPGDRKEAISALGGCQEAFAGAGGRGGRCDRMVAQHWMRQCCASRLTRPSFDRRLHPPACRLAHALAQLQSLGVQQSAITFTNVTMESDKFVCVRETGAQNQLVRAACRCCTVGAGARCWAVPAVHCPSTAHGLLLVLRCHCTLAGLA